jgi:Uma2 family endonuclease
MTDTAHEPATSITFEDDLELPAAALTLEGFRRWYATREGRGPRASWLGGRIYVEMSPQSYKRHEPIVQAVNAELVLLARQSGLGRYYMPPSWVTEASTGLSTEPDGFLVRWSSFQSGRVRVNPEREIELVGAPDMALEVVSKSSKQKDEVDLPTLYASAGVAEYWLADGRHDGPPTLRILTLRDGAYDDLAPDAEGWLASPLWGRRFRLVAFTNAAGQPDARLEVR